jgi:hypothetical protein
MMLDLDYKPGVSQEEMAGFVRSLTTEDVIEREIAAGQPFGPMHQRWQLDRAPTHVVRMLRRAKDSPLVASRQGFMGMDTGDANPSSFTSIDTTVTESCLWCNPKTTSLQTTWAAIPAGDMRAGKVYKVSCGGTIAVTSTPTCIWTPRVGPNATAANAANLSMGASPTITSVASLNHPFYGEFTMVVRSLGLLASLATTAGSGFVTYGNASATGTMAVMGGTIPTTVDQTVLSGLLINLTWGTSSASNTCVCTWVVMQSAN